MKTDGEIREAMMLSEMREKAIMNEQSRLNGARKEGIEKENSNLLFYCRFVRSSLELS